MRITTRLRITSTVTIVALVVLAPVLVWSFIEFKNAKNDYILADTIKVNFFERASFRDQYFLYREDRARTLWEKNKETADQLLLQANIQFHREEDQLVLERLSASIEDTAAIFRRIVNNTEALKTADGNRQVYEELDKRLYSQLLMKANAVRDAAIALQDASARRIELSYEHMTILVGLFAITLALTTILTSIQLDRLIRKRLEPLHDGAKIVADGDLDYRIQCGGTDEFAELALSINAMTDKLVAEIGGHKQAEQTLAESESRFREIFDTVSDAIFIHDAETGRIIDVNRRMCEMYGFTREQALVCGADDLNAGTPPYSSVESNEKIRLARTECPQVFDWLARTRDGRLFWVEVSLRVALIGNQQRILAVVRDITERKQIENKLARAHAELQQFTHIAAHHLQEPTRRLVSFVQRLRTQIPTEQLNEDAVASLHFIEQGAVRQSSLVRDIQLYIAADQPRSAVEKVVVSTVIANLLERRASLISETGAQVYYNDIPPVYIDRPRLKDIFSILLDNSLHYCHPKITPHIRITGELKEGRVVFCVADNGIGIQPEYRERVFGVFERLQVRDDQNSTGIGLAIVRRIIESCGGSVALQETPGGGATVLFDLPG
ncbi:MAG TPA: PAS domain S-box protein [Methylobacter sp.]|jgi:PAS domain S-box-containing protein